MSTIQQENLFARIGISDEAVEQRIEECFNTIFFDENERFYYQIDADKACMLDTGNIDARTEGMSYGMMMAVQRNRQDIFDKLWLFSKTFMWTPSGKYEGNFAWSTSHKGIKNADGPAPDGEEYYAMALMFASARWGDREAPFDYTAQARDILRHCVHQEELVKGGRAMWDPANKLIRFVPEADFSDPSYHLPHFYKLFALHADEADRPFWAQAAQASIDYIKKSCHPVTGMASEYAEFDGTPKMLFKKKGQYYSDAYRVAINIALYTRWFGEEPGFDKIADGLQAFFHKNPDPSDFRSYMVDGTPLEEKAMHPTAIVASNAAASAASKGPYAEEWLRIFWNTPLRKGNRRYYDNCLYFFTLLLLGGQYKRFL